MLKTRGSISVTTIQTIDFARALLNETLSSARSFPDDSSSFFQDTILLNYLNRSQEELANEMIQSFENYFVTSTTIDLTNGTEEYSLHTSVIKIVRMEWNDTGREISPISLNDKDDLYSIYTGVTSANEVKAYAIKGDSVIFKPTPGSTKASAIKYFYVQKPTILTASSDVSIIPSQYHELMGWSVYKKALFQQEGNADAINLADREYQRLLRNFRQWIEQRQIQSSRRVKRRKYKY